MFISSDIVNEIEKTLREKFELEGELVKRHIKLILSYCHLISITEDIDFIKEDPEDNKILACALAADAEYIVSGDSHLLNLKEFRGIKILSAKEFMELVR